MSQALDMRAFSALGLPPEADVVPSAPPVVLAKRAGAAAGEAFAATGVKLDALDVSTLDLPRPRSRRPLGLGAATSFLLHMALVLGALLWSQSQVERAPEPIAVEIVVERAPDPAPVAETPGPPEPELSPVAEAPPPPEPLPSPVAEATPTPEPIPSPVAEVPPPPTPTPEPLPSPVAEVPPPPTPTPEPLPSPVATVEPPAPVAETPLPTPEPVPSPFAEAPPPPKPVVEPKPLAKIEPPKLNAAPKKADRAPTPAKPKPVASRDATAAAASPSSPRAAASASSASVGEYRDAVYARIRARQHFPESARESGAHGTAELSFALDEAGQLKSVAIVKSSGEAALDADALATVRRSAPFGPPPPGAARDYAVKLHYALQ